MPAAIARWKVSTGLRPAPACVMKLERVRTHTAELRRLGSRTAGRSIFIQYCQSCSSSATFPRVRRYGRCR
eukprot:501197-Prymnesium_polylepis.2